MGDNNILPKGGFLRGVLAGLTLIVLVFIGLAGAFPLIVTTSPAPTIVSEVNIAPAQPVLDLEESSSGIFVNTDAPTPTQLIATPAPLGNTSPEVVIEPETAAPVSIAPQIAAMPTNDIQISSNESTPPVITSPTVAAIEMPVAADTPSVEETTQAPVVSTEISSGAGENDTTSELHVIEEVVESAPAVVNIPETPTLTEVTETPTASVELAGQTLIPAIESASDDAVEVEQPVPNRAFSTFSAEFFDDGERPLMSFILLVNTVDQAKILTSFTTPITLAVAANNPDANDIIANYRADGGEAVLLLPSEGDKGLRKGGNPSDVSMLLTAALANIDGVLGVLDGPDGNVNQDTRMMGVLLAELSKGGHAILTVNGLGLNRTGVLAQEAGVPATDISRVVNTDNGTIAVVRELDKLVLQIGNKQSVTVFAEATPDMLFALKFWLESKKAQAVTIAPVSASILRN
ncbi:MAG: hypothetical protein COA53_05440 [Rhodobacteraceae bacterium]|nr:MAG: hypothetical protein COA53_05440 [Paracoccaceae bacterium]